MPSFPIYSKPSAVAASCEKSNSLPRVHPRAFPRKRQPTSHCFRQQTEEKETFNLIKLSSLMPVFEAAWLRYTRLAPGVSLGATSGTADQKDPARFTFRQEEPWRRRALSRSTGNSVRLQSLESLKLRATHSDNQLTQHAGNTGTETQLGNAQIQQATCSFHACARCVCEPGPGLYVPLIILTSLVC